MEKKSPVTRIMHYVLTWCIVAFFTYIFFASLFGPLVALFMTIPLSIALTVIIRREGDRGHSLGSLLRRPSSWAYDPSCERCEWRGWCDWDDLPPGERPCDFM